MCCFSQPVVSVSDTNLFAKLTGDQQQFLVYQMQFESKEINAMILPLPVATPADEKSVEFISLKDHDDFFEQLRWGFPAKAYPSRSSGGVDMMADTKTKLAVIEVGDFVASFVPSVKDFSRLDKRFVIPKESWDKIPEYSNYGFAVFQLKELSGKPHPMAFKFKTRFEDQVFFPTVHIHDGEVHKREEFDHSLYVQHEKFDEACGGYDSPDHKDPATGYVRSKWKAGEFLQMDLPEKIVDKELLVHRLTMKGKLENKDVFVDLSRSLVSHSRTSLTKFWPVIPAALGVVGAGWFFKRRDKIRAEKS